MPKQPSQGAKKGAIEWKTETRLVKDLLPADYNPRQMTETQVANLRKSLERFNLADPIIINANNVIVGGHQRIRILADMGVEEVDVRVPNRKLDEKEEKELNLRLNGNKGEWDYDLLANNFDVEFLQEVGFDEKELARLLGKTDIVDDEFDGDGGPGGDTPERVKEGEIWELGDHRLMCGDSTKRAMVEELMGGGMADMVFTDPPYGVKYVGKTKKALTIKNDAMDEEGTAELWLAAYSEARNVLKNGGVVYATVPARPLHLLFAQVMKDFGDLRQILVWAKDAFVLGRSDYHYRHEPILYGWKSDGPHDFFGGRDQDTIWNINRPKKSEEHPTMKPIELCARAIENSSAHKGVVLDIFGGSGSTLMACEQTGRHCRMIELDPRYCEVILTRWEKMTGKTATLCEK